MPRVQEGYPPYCEEHLAEWNEEEKIRQATAKPLKPKKKQYWRDPLGIARNFAESTDWCRWRGGWYRLGDAGWYEESSEELVRTDLYEVLDARRPRDNQNQPAPPTQTRISAVLDGLKSVALYEGEAPGWIDGWWDEEPASELLVVKNGLLHLPKRSHIGSGVCGRHDTLFTLTGLPFDYDPSAECPRWFEFLLNTWDDIGSIAALQEWFGYVISGRTDLEKVFLLWGPRRSGKGTVAAVLQALVGEGNHPGTTLSNLGRNFGVASLIGKTLAVIGDARLGRRDPSEIVERLLSISGRDIQTIPRKYKDDWTGRLGVRFMVLTNELPELGDASGTVASRFVVLRTSKSHEGSEDLELRGRLLDELPGILNWALDGLARLEANGRFSTPASMAEDVADLHDLASSVGRFVRECCAVGPYENGYRVHGSMLYTAWVNWATPRRIDPGNDVQFGKNLRAAVPSVTGGQAPRAEGRVREYRGIDLIDPITGARHGSVTGGVTGAL